MPNPFVDQWRFKSGKECNGCESGSLHESMPKFFYDNSYVRAPDQDESEGCQRYLSTSQSSPVSYIWFSINGDIPCKVLLRDGSSYKFLKISYQSQSQELFIPPSNCHCSKPIDIALVLDRSGSITFHQWNDIIGFLKGFIDSFTWGPQSANLAIVNFNTIAFGEWNSKLTGMKRFLPPPLIGINAGNNNNAVSNLVNSLKCCNKPTDGNLDGSCCDGGTAIAAGIRAGVDELSHSKRDYATKIIVLLTDGKVNTLFSPTQDPQPCYSSCCGFAFVQSETGENCPDDLKNPGAQYLSCIGDLNHDHIPDTWYGNIDKEQQPCYGNYVDQYGYPATICNPPRPCCADNYVVNCKKNCQFNNCNGTYCNPKIRGDALARCHMDLINARQYGYDKIGSDLVYYAVGVGDGIAMDELEIITNNRYKKDQHQDVNWTPRFDPIDKDHPERILFASDWNVLAGSLLELTSKVCDENTKSCGDSCCGVCICGKCVPPTSCSKEIDNYCDIATIIPNSGCCSITNRTCPQKNCFTSYCDRNANEGEGKCIEQPINCPPETECYNFVCENNTGNCVRIFKGGAPIDSCHVTYCDESKNVLVVNQPIVCPTLDPCFNYTCVPVGNTNYQCKSSPLKPPPSPSLCSWYECDSKRRNDMWKLNNKTCNSINDDLNKCITRSCNDQTGLCTEHERICKNITNKCDISLCVPESGECDYKRKHCEPFLNSNRCFPLKDCDPKSGKCEYSEIKCEKKDCYDVQCNSTSGICETQTTGCEGICRNTSCNSLNNQCYEFSCKSDVRTTNPTLNDLCNEIKDLSRVNCIKALENSCLVYDGCNNETGCIYHDFPSCGEPDNKCNTYIRNPDYVGCCQEVSLNSCKINDPCYFSECDPTSGSCISHPICDYSSDNECQQTSCVNGKCITKNTNCSDNISDSCIVPLECDVLLGCKYEPINCDDDNKCTDDICSNGTCYHTFKICDDGNLCTTDSCDTENGFCVYKSITCDDKNNCTDDKCSPTEGCTHQQVNQTLFCDDNNLCTIDTCPLEVGSCVYNTISCDSSNQSPCFYNVCIPQFGCVSQSIVCVIDENGIAVQQNESSTTINTDKNNSDCSYATCVDNECKRIETTCFVPYDYTSAIIIGTTVGGSIIAGIVVGLIFAFGFASAGIYAYIQSNKTSSEATVQNNPLYHSKSTTENVLYEPKS
eukprot:TRINITY_DN912_c0_g1_i2.p1 TRINITY_DN912_c0_g1~~TRINITY_DN912_c0_g1_i2.p1  ORF type:complete len:1188 (+),score=72.65 TRINITY_DN912_c0_g1_i2:149-3712(+)